MFLVIIFAGVFGSAYAADSNTSTAQSIESKIVYQDFLLTVYKNPDGTHEAYTAAGLRDSVAEGLFNKKEAARSKKLGDESKK